MEKQISDYNVLKNQHLELQHILASTKDEEQKRIIRDLLTDNVNDMLHIINDGR
jgi:hypothetical protein